jgi:MFS family permease
MFAVLCQRNFALLWLGDLISLTGDWLLIVALPFFIYQHTGSVLATGTMFIVEVLPRLFLGSLVGVFVDRWNRRKTMIVADIARALILLPLLLVQSNTWLWVIYLVAFIQAVFSQFFGPAEAALIPLLVDEENLIAANALNSLSEELTRLIGPTLGGFLFAAFGLSSVVYLDSASYVFSAMMILLIAMPHVAESKAGVSHAVATFKNIWREWLEGLQLMRKDRLIAALFIIVGVAMIGEGTGRTVFVPFFSMVTRGNAFAFGWIITAQGAGGIIGALLIGRLGKLIQPVRLVALGGVLSGLASMVETTIRTLPVILMLSPLTGIGVVFFFVSVYTLLQKSVTDAFRGRVFGAYSTNNTLLLLIGLGISSGFASQTGVISMMYAMGGFYFLAGVVAFWLLHSPLKREQQESSS